MALNYFWKVWLRLNLLNKGADDNYIAEVSTLGSTKRNEDIARKIIEEGSEIKYDTLLNILNQRDHIVRCMLQEGNSVLTGCEQMNPRVNGPWLGSAAKFDANIHKLTVDMIPSSELRKALEEVNIEVLGIKDSGAYIGLVTDTATGLTDGVITPNDDILIKGDKLRIVPEDETGLGVVFIDENGNHIFVTRRLTLNEPKKVLARVPALPKGKYTLQIRTRFSQGNRLLNKMRIIEYVKPLIIS